MWRSTPTLLAALSSRARRHGGAMVWPPSVGTRLSICTLAQPEERMVYLMSPVHHQYTIIVRKLRQLLTVIPELVQMQVYRMVQLSKKRNRVMISWELTSLEKTNRSILNGRNSSSRPSSSVPLRVPMFHAICRGLARVMHANGVSGVESPRHEAAAHRLQKVYKSFRARWQLADTAMIVGQSWWKLLDFGLLKHSSVPSPLTSRSRRRYCPSGQGRDPMLPRQGHGSKAYT